MANSSMLSIGKIVPVLVTHVEFHADCCIGYGQFCEPEIVDTVSEQVIQAVASSSPVKSPEEGDIILALYREDATWYRAKVLTVRENKISVIFIDYGNVEVVDILDARLSPPELKQYPSLAVRCVLEDVNPSGNTWSESDKEKLHEDLINKEFTAEVTDIENNGLVISLSTDNGQYIYGKKDLSKDAKSLKAMTLKVGESYQSYIAYVDSANKFWIQLKQFETNLEKLMQDIATHVEIEARPLPQAKRGTCCIAKFSEDAVPYRSKVLGITGDKCLVQFIDYGNSESKSLTDLMEIPPKFCQLPIQGFKCCYKRSKLKSNTLDEKVQELTADEDGVLVTVVSKSSDEYTIEIDKIEIISGAESLESPTNQSFASLQLESNIDFDACISHVFHPGRFYVQIIENGPILDSLMNKISQEFMCSPNLSSPANGTPCLAQMSDGVCYRAVVVACKHNRVLVLAVDFGIEEWCDISQLKELSSRNIQIPTQALECTVDLTKTDDKHWSAKEIRILSAFESKDPLIAKVTGKRGTVLQLDLHDTKDPELDRYVNAELLGVGKSSDDASIAKQHSKVATDILVSIPKPDITIGAKELVCITAMKSPSQFYAQRTKIESITEIEKLQLQLQTTYECYRTSDGVLKSIGIGDSCCTKYIDGGWYRAIVTAVDHGKIEATCADFGDSIKCSLSDLKMLLGKFASLPQQCIICEISSLDSGVSKEVIENTLVNQVVEIQIKQQKDFPFPLFEADFTSHPNNGKILQKLRGPSLPRIPKPAMSNHVSNSSFAENLDNYQPTVVSLYSSEEVMITHVIDPQHFHCQLKKYATQLDDLMQQLDEHCKNLGPHDDYVENVHLSQPCLAKFSTDNSWYRAKITGILAGKNLVEVLYVDYGNTECQERDGLKIIPSKYLILPSQAIFCGMSGVAPSQGFWPPEHITQFEDLTLDQNFNTIFKKWNKEEDRYFVEMTTLAGESFNLKFGSMSNSLCLEQPDDNQTSRSVEMGKGIDMTVKVEGHGFIRHQSNGSDGFGAASRSFGGRDDDSSRGGRRGGRDGGFGGDRGGLSSGFGSGNKGLGRSDDGDSRGFGGGRGGGRGGRSSGFGGSNTADEDWGDGSSASSSGGFGGNRSFGGDRGGRQSGFGRGGRSNFGGDRGGRGSFGGDRGERSGFGRDNDDSGSDGGFGRRGGSGGRGNFGGNRGGRGSGRGSFGGDRGSRGDGFGRSSGFGRDQDENASDQGSEGGFGRRGGRGGGFGSDRGGRGGSFSSDRGSRSGFGSDRGRRGGGFGSDRGGRGGGFGSDRGGRGGGFGSDRGGRGGGSGSDRGGRGGGFGSDRGGRGGGFGSDRGGRGGGFGSDRGGRGGGFGSDRGGRGGGFASDRGGRGGGFGSDRGGHGGGFGGGSSSVPNTSVDVDWGDATTQAAPQPTRGFSSSKGGGNSWDTNETSSTSTMIQGGGVSQDKWAHKNLNRFAAQKLVLGKSFQVSVVYSNSPGEFWCQSQDQVEALEAMSEKMNEEYNKIPSSELNIDEPRTKSPCVAKFSEDDLWYRAEILEVKGKDVDVYFVDYGNTESVALSYVKALKSEYFSLPVQGIKCCLNNIKPVGSTWSEKSNDDLSELTTEKKIEIKLIDQDRGTYTADLTDVGSGVNIADKLIEIGHATRSSSAKQLFKNPYPSTVLLKDSSHQVFLSWIDNPHQFWIQLSDKIDDLENLTQKVQDEYTTGSGASNTVQSAQVGMSVIAQFTDDSSWYRAFIESTNDEKYCVRFVDYGNCDMVEIDKLRQPTSELLKENCFAYRCKLTGVKPLQSGSWNVDSKDIMESLLSDDPASCKVKVSNKDEYVVQITAGTTDFADELVNAAVARREETMEFSSVSTARLSKPSVSLPLKSMQLGKEVSCYVSSFVCPSKMFIQLASEEDKLNELRKNLQESYNDNVGDSATDPKRGEIYCTKYNEDNDWYRAEVEDVRDKVTVCFVDYGNSENVSCEDLKILKSEFASLPAFAQKCCLSKVQPTGDKWSDEAITLFEESVTDQVLTVKFITDSEVAITNEAGDIAQQLVGKGYAEATAEPRLTPLTVEATVLPKGEVPVYISSVDGRSFYLQLASQEEKLQTLANQLQTICPSSQNVSCSALMKGSYCCAKFSEDEQWYRAVVKEITGDDVSLTFVDYGNGETVPASTLKCLSKDILFPAMAFHCCLVGCDNVSSTKIEEKISGLTESTELIADFRCVINDMCQVILKENAVSISGSLGGEEPSIEEPAVLNLENQLLPKEEVSVYISSVEGKHFYLQLASQENELLTLANQLQTSCPSLQTVNFSTLKVGDSCCAKCSEDQQWYRATVHEISGGNASVTFVDYGNGETVPASSLKYLSKDIVIPAMGFHCCLYGCDHVESSEIETKLSELTESSEITAVFCGMVNQMCEVVLCENGASVNQSLGGKDPVSKDVEMEQDDVKKAEGGKIVEYKTLDETGLCDSMTDADFRGVEGRDLMVMDETCITLDQTGFSDVVDTMDSSLDEKCSEQIQQIEELNFKSEESTNLDDSGMMDQSPDLITHDQTGDFSQSDGLITLDQTGEVIHTEDFIALDQTGEVLQSEDLIAIYQTDEVTQSVDLTTLDQNGEATYFEDKAGDINLSQDEVIVHNDTGISESGPHLELVGQSEKNDQDGSDHQETSEVNQSLDSIVHTLCDLVLHQVGIEELQNDSVNYDTSHVKSENLIVHHEIADEEKSQFIDSTDLTNQSVEVDSQIVELVEHSQVLTLDSIGDKSDVLTTPVGRLHTFIILDQIGIDESSDQSAVQEKSDLVLCHYPASDEMSAEQIIDDKFSATGEAEENLIITQNLTAIGQNCDNSTEELNVLNGSGDKKTGELVLDQTDDKKTGELVVLDQIGECFLTENHITLHQAGTVKGVEELIDVELSGTNTGSEDLDTFKVYKEPGDQNVSGEPEKMNLISTEELVILDQTGEICDDNGIMGLTDNTDEYITCDQVDDNEHSEDRFAIDQTGDHKHADKNCDIKNTEEFITLDHTGDTYQTEDQNGNMKNVEDIDLINQSFESAEELVTLDLTGEIMLNNQLDNICDIETAKEVSLLDQSNSEHQPELSKVDLTSNILAPEEYGLQNKSDDTIGLEQMERGDAADADLAVEEVPTLDKRSGINNSDGISSIDKKLKDIYFNCLSDEVTLSNLHLTTIEDPLLSSDDVDQPELEDMITLDQTGTSDITCDQTVEDASLALDLATEMLENTLYETCLTLDRTGFSETETGEESEDAKESVVGSIKDLKSITLKEGQRLPVKVSHYDSPSKFFVHVEDNTAKIDSLLDDMFNFYSVLPKGQYDIAKIEPQMICACKFSEDESWYRANVMSVDGENCNVFFLDHGNSEESKITSLKQLVTKFAELPIQGVPCILSGIGSSGGDWSESDLALFAELTEDKSLLADIVGLSKGRAYIVQLLDMGISVGQKMIEKADCVVVSTPRINTKVRRVFSDSSDLGTPAKVRMSPLAETDSIAEDTFYGFHTLQFETDKEYLVKVSQIENPTCFWCQVKDIDGNFQKLSDSLQHKYSESVDLVNTIDTACVAKCKGDEKFYRGVTQTAIENDYITVLFVDYGSVYCIRKEDVKAIIPEDLELPMQAVDCMLHDIDLTESLDDWEGGACAFFEEFCDGKELTMIVKQVCNEGLSVYLRDKDSDTELGLLLAEEGFVNITGISVFEESLQAFQLDESHVSEATPKKTRTPRKQMTAEVLGRLLSTDSEYRVTISHVDNPSNFYVIFPCNAIEEIEEKIKESFVASPDDRLSEEKLVIGTECLACCKDISDWQRGKIDEIKEDCVLVHMVDIGNKELVPKSDLRMIPDSLKDYPPQALLCELEDIKPVDGLNEWSEETTVYFQDVCAPGEEMVIYFCERNGDKLKVSLFDGSIETQKELDQQVGVQLVKLGFADVVPGSVLEEIIEEEENTEPAFNEMSLQRENSYGSTGLDDSSICPGDTTTDISAYPDESELETTASDSFSYVDFKPVPKLAGDIEVKPSKDDEEDDEFYDAEDENKGDALVSEGGEFSERSTDQQIESVKKGTTESSEQSDQQAESIEKQDSIELLESKDEGATVESEEEDTVKCESDEDSVNEDKPDIKDENVDEVLEKFEECNIDREKFEPEGNSVEKEAENVGCCDSKEIIEKFIKHSVEEVAVERYKKEMMENENEEKAQITKETNSDIESKLDDLQITDETVGKESRRTCDDQQKDVTEDSEEKTDNNANNLAEKSDNQSDEDEAKEVTTKSEDEAESDEERDV